MSTGAINNTYRIERLNVTGCSACERTEQWVVIMSGPMTTEDAHSKYDAYRNNRPDDTYRLVRITEYAERCGKGKVFV